MAIYHLEAKVITRGAGRSAVAAAAYMSCAAIHNDYDGVQHDYTKKHGLVWEQVFLPAVAPREWGDRAVLWNAVEAAEKTKDSRLARELIVALPVEMGRDRWIAMLTEFVQTNFVAMGMCADVSIHDTDGHNPHAHILLTIRPLTEKGTWQSKTEKEYLCVRNGEERGFTAAEFKSAQDEGWEKQYQYKVGKKKVYMTPSAAEVKGYERASKYPKSSKFGRQNPISEKWNSEEQLVLWRSAWCDEVNAALEHIGSRERVDHRSHAERGLDEQPTIHEGVTARIIEQRGGISERCELNRQIRADNAHLRELKAIVAKLVQAVKDTLPAIADFLESLRTKMIVSRYRQLYVQGRAAPIRSRLKFLRPKEQRVTELDAEIKGMGKERKSLVAKREQTSVTHILQKREFAHRIDEITNKLRKLHSERLSLLEALGCVDSSGLSSVREEISRLEASLNKLDQQERKCNDELATIKDEFEKARAKAENEFDSDELHDARRFARPEKEQTAQRRLQNTYGDGYSQQMMADCRRDVSRMLDEEMEDYSIHVALRQQKQKLKRESQHQHKSRQDRWDR